jgi:hypothetical protein
VFTRALHWSLSYLNMYFNSHLFGNFISCWDNYRKSEAFALHFRTLRFSNFLTSDVDLLLYGRDTRALLMNTLSNFMCKIRKTDLSTVGIYFFFHTACPTKIVFLRMKKLWLSEQLWITGTKVNERLKIIVHNRFKITIFRRFGVAILCLHIMHAINKYN